MSSLCTPSESKFVGWDDEKIDVYPSLSELTHSDRITLLRWYRYLRLAETEEEVRVIHTIAYVLKETLPVHDKSNS